MKSLAIKIISKKSSIFWDITPWALLATCFALGSCLAYSSTLKMEATRSSETSVDFHRTTRRYNPEVRTFHKQRCENLKYCTEILLIWLVYEDWGGLSSTNNLHKFGGAQRRHSSSSWYILQRFKRWVNFALLQNDINWCTSTLFTTHREFVHVPSEFISDLSYRKLIGKGGETYTYMEGRY
jgi:hypothetical protein